MCSATSDASPWCLVDDNVTPYWLNTADGQTRPAAPGDTGHKAPDGVLVGAAGPVRPDGEQGQRDVLSFFVMRNQCTGEAYVEYIEPLVAGLRHPLAGCVAADGLARASGSLWPLLAVSMLALSAAVTGLRGLGVTMQQLRQQRALSTAADGVPLQCATGITVLLAVLVLIEVLLLLTGAAGVFVPHALLAYYPATIPFTSLRPA